MDMNWEAIGAIGEIVGAIAVVATLAYLAFQIKVSRQATIADMYQRRAQSRSDIHRSVALNDPGFASILNRYLDAQRVSGTKIALEGLTKEERFRYSQWTQANVVNMDNVYFQYRRGLIEKDVVLKMAEVIPDLAVEWSILDIQFPSVEFEHFVKEVGGT